MTDLPDPRESQDTEDEFGVRDGNGMTDLPDPREPQDDQPNPSGDIARHSREVSLPDDTNQPQILVEQWSGPLPSPSDLKEFDNIVPGFAKELTNLCIAQVEHRMDIDRKLTESSTRATTRGQWTAFVLYIVLGLASLGVASFVVLAGSEGWQAGIGWGAVIVIAQIIVISGALIRNLRRRSLS